MCLFTLELGVDQAIPDAQDLRSLSRFKTLYPAQGSPSEPPLVLYETRLWCRLFEARKGDHTWPMADGSNTIISGFSLSSSCRTSCSRRARLDWYGSATQESKFGSPDPGTRIVDRPSACPTPKISYSSLIWTTRRQCHRSEGKQTPIDMTSLILFRNSWILPFCGISLNWAMMMKNDSDKGGKGWSMGLNELNIRRCHAVCWLQ